MKKLQDFHIDLALLWQSMEGYSIRECLKRLEKMFGIKVTYEALRKRMARRLEKRGQDLHIPVKVRNPQDFTDKELLDWFKYLMYSHVYSAEAKGNVSDLRKNIEVSIKILNAINTLTGVSREEKLSEVDMLMQEFRQSVN